MSYEHGFEKGTGDVERSIIGSAKARLVIVLALGLTSLFFLFIVSVSLGAVSIPFSEVVEHVVDILVHGGPGQADPTEQILWLRMVRGIAVIGVGIGLSVAGVVMQALIRNPMVDPYITGISSGAGLGATLAIIVGFSFFQSSVFTVPIAAFIGALAAFALTMTLAEAAGGRSINYILGGIIIGIALASITNILITFSTDTQLHTVIFWLFGSFEYVTWTMALLIVIPVMVLSIIIMLYARELNVMMIGDDHAKQLGLNVKLFKRMMAVLVSLITAISVAFCGVIAFLGLVVPHSARMIVGGDHRLLLPASMVIGASVLLAADIFARIIIPPLEIPIGAIVSLVGAPFFVYLMIRRGNQYAG